ncbi:universal stress protein [Algibacter sp. L4_22]|uniref:universal stress protein n=1 Tax=Algibacter sp. L4_22 TaxID=2942477 RepID=UPI00201B5458|nr:universal stress protein [Algibacter sp. L4_22]MCL5129312.1 universal stress protein [Algibacter sp. L4_22]
MKKILIPTDFSENSWSTVLYASELYKDEPVDFYLVNAFNVDLHILDNIKSNKPENLLFEESMRKSQLELYKLLVKIKGHCKNKKHNFFTKSLLNSSLETIRNYIETKHIELVIVSDIEETDDFETIKGSHDINIMKNVIDCPVLIIPAGWAFKGLNEIVFPTNFKTHYKCSELTHLYEIAKITNAPIIVLHCVKEENLSQDEVENKALLEACLDGFDFSFHYLENTNANSGLQLFVQSRESEMIVFINKKNTLFGSILTKPMVKDLGHNLNVPVLALHDLRN